MRIRSKSAFTLIEMLAVMSIIAILAALIVPNLHALRASDAVDGATRQMLADFSLARARAINGRKTVAVVFIPPWINTIPVAGYTQQELDQVSLLQGGTYTTYALFSFRQVGDQPGRCTPRYLTEWTRLPDRTFFATNKFFNDYNVPTGLTNIFVQAFDRHDFPFPFARSTNLVSLPYIAFSYEGHLFDLDLSQTGYGADHQDATRLPLARGYVINGVPEERPPGNSVDAFNHILIDWLSGRGRLERQQVQ